MSPSATVSKTHSTRGSLQSFLFKASMANAGLILGFYDPPALKHVVEDDQAIGPKAGKGQFVTEIVARLVRVDEGKVKRGLCRHRLGFRLPARRESSILPSTPARFQ